MAEVLKKPRDWTRNCFRRCSRWGQTRGHTEAHGDTGRGVSVAKGAPASPRLVSPWVLSTGPWDVWGRGTAPWGHQGDTMPPQHVLVPHGCHHLLQGVHPEQGADAHQHPLVLGQAGHPARHLHAGGIATVLQAQRVSPRPLPCPQGPCGAAVPRGAPAHHGDGLLQGWGHRLVRFPALPPVGFVVGSHACGLGHFQLEGERDTLSPPPAPTGWVLSPPRVPPAWD